MAFRDPVLLLLLNTCLPTTMLQREQRSLGKWIGHKGLVQELNPVHSAVQEGVGHICLVGGVFYILAARLLAADWELGKYRMCECLNQSLSTLRKKMPTRKGSWW